MRDDPAYQRRIQKLVGSSVSISRAPGFLGAGICLTQGHAARLLAARSPLRCPAMTRRKPAWSLSSNYPKEICTPKKIVCCRSRLTACGSGSASNVNRRVQRCCVSGGGHDGLYPRNPAQFLGTNQIQRTSKFIRKSANTNGA